jgi:hypothetical protein
MSDNATSMPERRSCAEHKVRDELEKLSPRRWIYRNLTPWRIHACFAPDGKLLTARGPAEGELPCDKCVGQVLSIRWRQRAPVGVARGGCGRRPFGRPDHRHGP